jgi:hypothetical protein
MYKFFKGDSTMFRFNMFLMFAILCGLAIVTSGCGGGDVAAPTSFSEYNASNGDFAVEFPEGWDSNGHGKQNHFFEAKKGGASITVKSSLAGSLMGSIADSGMSMMTGGDTTGMDEEYLEDLSSEAQVHQMGQEAMKEQFGDEYTEGDAEKITPSLGEGRMSEFTGTVGFGQEVSGIRATVLARDKSVTVVCTCPTSNYEALKPAFQQVIDSLKLGEEEI